MSLLVRPLGLGRTELRSFVELPYRLHARLEHWVPPLRRDVHALFDTKKNPFFDHAEVRPFVAERVEGGRTRVVGRICAIENRAHNETHGDRVGFFGFFECEEDPEAAAALFDAAEGWLAERGLDTMRGPTNFSTNDDCGLLVRGFHRPPTILTPYHPPYYERLVEDAGFAKARDLVAFWYEGQPPEFLVKAADRVRRKRSAVTRPLDMRRFPEEVDTIRRIYNAAWEKNWGFVPMTDREIDHLAGELRPVIEPALVRFAEVEGEVVAFTLGLPDYNQVLARLGGRMGLLGLLRLWWYRSRIDCARVLTLGVLEGHRGSGIDVLLYHDLFVEGLSRGIWRGEFSWVLEDNLAMTRPLERIGAVIDRTYRIYDRPVRGRGAGA